LEEENYYTTLQSETLEAGNSAAALMKVASVLRWEAYYQLVAIYLHDPLIPLGHRKTGQDRGYPTKMIISLGPAQTEATGAVS
jgi:hypothetical protein